MVFFLPIRASIGVNGWHALLSLENIGKFDWPNQRFLHELLELVKSPPLRLDQFTLLQLLLVADHGPLHQ